MTLDLALDGASNTVNIHRIWTCVLGIEALYNTNVKHTVLTLLLSQF